MSTADRKLPAGASSFARGAAWSTVNAAAGVVLPFAVFIMFARWLTPAQVGVVVLAVAIAEIVKALGLAGLYEALMQAGCGTRRHHQTASAVLLSCGLGLTALYVGILTLAAMLLPGVAQAGWALSLIGLRILFDLATVQPQAALAQRLAFRRMASRSVIANVGAGSLGAVIGLCGHPFEGLIAYLVAQSVLVFATTAIGTGAFERPALWTGLMSDLRREALSASVVRLVAAVNNSLDQVIVAGTIGSAPLAFFNLGKRIETTFITTAASFSTILFQPVFATRAGDQRARGLRHGLALLTLLCGAPAAFMVCDAQNVIHIVFGARWQGAAPVATILACSGFARALGSVHGALLSVSGRNRSLMWATCASAAGGIALVLSGSVWGIVAVSVALAVKNAAISGWMAVLTRNDLPRLGAIYAWVVLLPFAAMVGAGLSLRYLLADVLVGLGLPPAATLPLSGLVILAAGAGMLVVAVPIPLRTLWPSRARSHPQSWSIETP